MAPPRRGAVVDDSRSEASSGPRESKGKARRTANGVITSREAKGSSNPAGVTSAPPIQGENPDQAKVRSPPQGCHCYPSLSSPAPNTVFVPGALVRYAPRNPTLLPSRLQTKHPLRLLHRLLLPTPLQRHRPPLSYLPRRQTQPNLSIPTGPRSKRTLGRKLLPECRRRQNPSRRSIGASICSQ